MKFSKSEAGRLGAAASRITQQENSKKRRLAYEANPNCCKYCSSPISYEKKANKFCSQSCAATFNNIKTPKRVSGDVVVICEHCSKQFKKKPASPTKFCSLRCHIDYRMNEAFEKVEKGQAENSGQVKRYLLHKHGNKCLSPDCAWDFSKKQVNVELEHIDGDSTNNTLDNCTLLCPNCHSQTPTYKGKNKGNGRHYRRIRYSEGKSF